MKRLMILSSAFMLLGGAYAVSLEQRRRRRMEEQTKNLQVWESEGGSPMGGNAGAGDEPSLDFQPSESAYS
jgi:hypothetical protein